MPQPKISAAPDYTNAALIMMGVNLTWVFIAIWAIWGLAPVLLLAVALNHGITMIERRRNLHR